MDYLFDIDETLANNAHREHHLKDRDYETYFSKVLLDDPIWPVIHAATSLSKNNRIILVTGRPKRNKELTVAWLKKYHIPYDDIFMRSNNDYSPNQEVKRRLYHKIIEKGYQPQCVFEDNPKSVELWKSLGLLVLQVHNGNSLSSD